MTDYERLLLTLEGRMQFASVTGNTEDQEELNLLISLVKAHIQAKKTPHMCEKCDKGSVGSCFTRPDEVRNKKVISCKGFKKR